MRKVLLALWALGWLLPPGAWAAEVCTDTMSAGPWSLRLMAEVPVIEQHGDREVRRMMGLYRMQNGSRIWLECTGYPTDYVALGESV